MSVSVAKLKGSWKRNNACGDMRVTASTRRGKGMHPQAIAKAGSHGPCRPPRDPRATRLSGAATSEDGRSPASTKERS